MTMRILGAPSDKALQFPEYEEGDDPFEVCDGLREKKRGGGS